MKFTQIRHATCIIDFAGQSFAVDPILYGKHTLEPVKGGIDRKNPFVDLPVSKEHIRNVDAILLTHTHRDHFDPEIIHLYGSNIPIICSGEYHKHLMELGFTNIKPIVKDGSILFEGIKIVLVKGKHGTGIVGKLMGNSYGFILEADGHGTLYITGDTVWCTCVEHAIRQYKPDYIIAFAGAATICGRPVTMDLDDTRCLLTTAPNARVIAIHLDSWNHCQLTRIQLRNALGAANLYIPKDGEVLDFTT